MLDFILYSLYFTFFYLGAILGSFLNVLVVEIEPLVFKKKTDKSFWERINRRSACPHCQTVLKPRNLFPIFSYLFQKGKCTTCKKYISIRYFLVEIFSGLIFLFLFIKIFHKNDFNFSLDFWLEYSFLIPIFMSFIIIFLFDLKHKIIPNIVIYPAIILTAVYSWIYFQQWEVFLVAFLTALPFFLLWVITRGKGIGFADWKLVFLLSMLLPTVFANVFFAMSSFWIGALYSLPLLYLSKKYSLKSEVPFGPFILTAFFLTYFFHNYIFYLYQNIL